MEFEETNETTENQSDDISEKDKAKNIPKQEASDSDNGTKILPTNSTPNQAVPKLLSPIQTPKESSQPTSDETCSNDEGFKFVKHSKKKIKHSKKTKKESEIKIVMCAANKNMAKLWFERASELMQLPMPKPENIKGLGDINNINHYTYISKLSKS